MATPRAYLAEGSVPKHLLNLTTPMIWGILAMMAFNLTDTWFVAQLGPAELAAMSFTFPVVMVLISLGIGLMAGTSSVLARAIGQNDHAKVRRLTTDALVLSLILSAALSVLGIATVEPLFSLLGASPTLLPLIREYMVPWYAGFVFFLSPMVGMGAIRATGDSRLQSRMMVGAALVNLILDPLLIFGLLGFPRLELQGAAVATVAARASMLTIGYWALRYKFDMLELEHLRLGVFWHSCKQVLHVGVPAAGTNMIIPVATAVIVAILARFGTEAVAGFGVASRIEGVSLVAFYAMSAIIGPFVGQNLGAGRCDRLVTAINISACFCLSFGLLLAAGLGLFAEQLTRLFNDDANVVRVCTLYLQLVPVSYGAAGVVMVVNAAFNGLGTPLPAVVISTTRMLLLLVPGAYLGALWFGLTGVFVATTLANLLGGLGAYLWYRHACRRIRATAALSPPSNLA
jgi:putative MATE family efflux protein